jgi:hypothetical protein
MALVVLNLMNKFQVYFDVHIEEVLIEHDDEENDM